MARRAAGQTRRCADQRRFVNADLCLAFKLRDPELRRRIDAYLKQAPGGRKLELRENAAVSEARGSSVRLRPRASAEGSGRSWRVLFDASGAVWSSTEAAERWAKREADGCVQAEFLVGGPDGWPGDAGADECWAFGRITLPHTLAALVAAEQLYRITTILAGHPYHLGHRG